MKHNAQILLEEMVNDEYKNRAPARMKDINKFFEFFVASQLMKDRELSDDEVLSGISDNDNKRDGGIDGLFLFGNRKFLQTVEDFEGPSVNEIEIIITQCKYTDKVPEEVIHKLEFAMKDLLNLSNELNSEEMMDRYDPQYLDTILTFRDLYRRSRSGVKIYFKFYVAHLAQDVAPHVIGKVDHLHDTVTYHIPEAESTLEFLNPQKLVAIVRQEGKQEFSLTYKRDIISPDERGFTCLINLYEYYKFIHDEDLGQIRENMFDANVRDFQGSNPVNDAIAATLQDSDSGIDFWWLNNGITMVANKVTRRGDALIIQNPEIVNGLQTSYTLHHHFSKLGDNSKQDNRHVLVRVVQMDEGADMSRNLIIRATNSQTPIPPLLLHATEAIHHDIEHFFRKSAPPFYYERRKSHYKNKGHKIDEIVSMQALAQAVAAILLRRPNVARSGIKAFLRSATNKNYQTVFNPNYPLSFFYNCAFLRKRTSEFLSSDDFSTDPKRRSLSRYVMYHIVMYASLRLTRNSEGPDSGKDRDEGLQIYAKQIGNLKPLQITDDVLRTSAEAVMAIFENEKYQGLPNSAKIDELVNDILHDAVTSLKTK